MISETTLTLLGLSTALTIFIPIVLAFIWIIKTKSYVYPLFIGAMIFFVFVMILESSMHSLVFNSLPIFNSNTVLYVLYGCLAAGLFEEGGRWLAFKYLIKSNDKKNAVTYGIGHGGIEMILVVGMTLLSSFIFAQSFNTLGIEGMMEGADASMQELILEMVESIKTYGINDVLLNLVERGSALLLHISCSVLVFHSVHNNNIKYLGYAFGLHMLMNLPAALAQRGIITNLWFVEILIFVVACISAYLGYKTYKKS